MLDGSEFYCVECIFLGVRFVYIDIVLKLHSLLLCRCTTSHQHRWTNHPMLVKCDWFLRYLEPYALLSDPIMYCGSSHVHRVRDGYCDWEEALQDGRVAWTNSQVNNVCGCA